MANVEELGRKPEVLHLSMYLSVNIQHSCNVMPLYVMSFRESVSMYILFLE